MKKYFGSLSFYKQALMIGVPVMLQSLIQSLVSLVDFSRIHTVVICGCGFPHWEGNFDSLKLMCKTCFGNPEMICVPVISDIFFRDIHFPPFFCFLL